MLILLVALCALRFFCGVKTKQYAVWIGCGALVPLSIAAAICYIRFGGVTTGVPLAFAAAVCGVALFGALAFGRPASGLIASIFALLAAPALFAAENTFPDALGLALLCWTTAAVGAYLGKRRGWLLAFPPIACAAACALNPAYRTLSLAVSIALLLSGGGKNRRAGVWTGLGIAVLAVGVPMLLSYAGIAIPLPAYAIAPVSVAWFTTYAQILRWGLLLSAAVGGLYLTRKPAPASVLAALLPLCALLCERIAPGALPQAAVTLALVPLAAHGLASAGT